MAALTFTQLEQLWTQAGGSADLAPTMAAIALAESSGNPDATNPTDNNGTQTSWGLWQISNGNHNMPDPNILTPLDNAKAAVAKYNSQGLGAWGTYTSGAYLKAAPSATNVAPPASAVGAVPGNSSTVTSSGAANPTSVTLANGQTFSTASANGASDATALSQIEANFAAYGFSGPDLQTLLNWTWQTLTSGMDPTQVALDIQTPGSAVYPVFEKYFPGFTEANSMRQSAGLPAISVADYQSYSETATQLANAAGLPAGFLNKDNIGYLIGHDVSADELKSRISDALALAYQSTDAQRAAFANYFGAQYQSQLGYKGINGADYGTPGTLTPGHIAALALDPTTAEPLIHQELIAAQVGGAGVTAGVGAVSKAEALAIAQANPSLSQGAIQSAVGSVAPLASLETALPGQGGIRQNAQTVSADTLVGTQLLPTATNVRELQMAQGSREEPFQQGGGYVQTSSGTATGSANSSGNGAGR